MSLQAAGANNPNIRNIQYIHYLQRPSSGAVTLVVNRTQYVGTYQSLADAQSAVEGILQKLGNKNAATRRAAIPTMTTDLTFTGDTTPTSVNWVDCSCDVTNDSGNLIPVFGSSQQQITGIDTTISLRFYVNNPDVELWVKTSSATIPTAASTAPSVAEGYTRLYNNSYINVSNNTYVRIKPNGSGTTDLTTAVTVVNANNASVLDTFNILYTYSEI